MRSIQTRSVTSKTASRRFEAVSSGPINLKLRVSAFSRMTSRRNCPIKRVASASGAARPGNIDRIIMNVRQLELALQQPAIGVRIGAHSPRTDGCKGLQFRDEAAGLVEQRVGLIAAHPLLEQL